MSADIVPVKTSLALLTAVNMKLRRSSNTTSSEDSLIVFCANYKKEKLQKIRQKYKNPSACLKCIRRTAAPGTGKKTKSSTPVVSRPERTEARTNLQHLQQPPALFYTTISPIPSGHNTEERIKRESLVRRKLFEKSLQAIIEEARTELLIEKLSRSLNNDYMNMNANNNSRVTKNKNSQEGSEEDEVYEEIMFNKQNENFYEPVSFNIYEPIDNFQ